MTAPRPLRASVAGGTLHGALWGPDPGHGQPLVLAVHGVTSSWVYWTLVADAVAAAGITVVAVDLRGRGDSADLPEPYGMAAHSRDLVAVLDAVGVPQAVLVGHSMGGFITAVTAERHPDRVAALLLVDGGLPLRDAPPGEEVHAVLEALVGPAVQRLRRRFTSRDEYRDFWRSHPAFAEIPDDLIVAYADHDLEGTAPDLRSKVSEAAVRADSRDILTNAAVIAAFERAPEGSVFLRAERGMLDDAGGLYPAERMAAARQRAPGLEVDTVAGTNHYSIGMSAHGAKAVAAHVVTLVRNRRGSA